MRKEHYTEQEFGYNIRNDILPYISELEYHISNVIDNNYMLEMFGEDPEMREDMYNSQLSIDQINATPVMLVHHLRSLVNLEMDLINNPDEPVLYTNNIVLADFGYDIFENILDDNPEVDPTEETPINLDKLHQEIDKVGLKLREVDPTRASQIEGVLGRNFEVSRDDVPVGDMY